MTAQDIASAGAEDSLSNMSLGRFLDDCDSGNHAVCIRKLGIEEGLWLGAASVLMKDHPACWPRDKNGDPDVRLIGQQIFDWLSNHPERRADKATAVMSDASDALYPCTD